MNKNLLNNLKKVAKALLFTALFICIYTSSREVLRNKQESEALGKIFSAPDNSYEVILAGSSHMQYGVQPYILEEKYSIKSCNTSTAAQSVPTTYYVVKEMIERHKPSIVAVDLFCLFYPEEYFTPTRFHQAIDNFPIGINKARAIMDLVKDDKSEDKSEFFLNYMLYHGRWKSLTKDDYTVQKDFDETKQVLYGVTEFENDFVPLSKSVKGEIPPVSLEYLKKIADLCKETDTRLIFVVIPYRADVDNNSVTGLYQQSLYNTAEELAREWDVDYINMLYNLDEMNFDFKTDMVEFSHLNESGTVKVSEYFGKILKGKLNEEK